MRFIKGFLKYIGFTLLGAIFSTLVGATAISYYAVQKLSDTSTPPPSEHPTELPNHNLREVARLTKTYITEIDLFEGFRQKLAAKTFPDFCSTVCNHSELDQERWREERTQYLVKFYEQQGAEALKDPLFRLKLEELEFMADAFPRSMRSLISQITESSAPNKQYLETFLLVLKFEATVLKEATQIQTRYENLVAGDQRLKDLRKILRSCHSGPSTKSLREQCQKIL